MKTFTFQNVKFPKNLKNSDLQERQAKREKLIIHFLPNSQSFAL